VESRKLNGKVACSGKRLCVYNPAIFYLFISSQLSRSSAPALHWSPRSPTRADPPRRLHRGVLASRGVTAPGRLAPALSPLTQTPCQLLARRTGGRWWNVLAIHTIFAVRTLAAGVLHTNVFSFRNLLFVCAANRLRGNRKKSGPRTPRPPVALLTWEY
jgi:hypothetical protein